jgi:hypothetical protein
MVERTERQLLDSERRVLAERRAQAQHAADAALRRFGLVSGGICAVLAVLTLLASDAPPGVILGFWTVVAIGIALWTGLPERRQARQRAAAYAAALAHDRALVTRVRSDRVVAFEEVEDEGACWAFDAGHDRTIFVAGQMYDTDEGFPSSDVTFVEVLLPNAAAVDELVTHHGRRLEPERWVSGTAKLSGEPPEHLEILDVPLDRIGR